MNKFSRAIYLIVLITLNFSCAEKKVPGKETNKSEHIVPISSEALKFTSGIRAIFQDSKGNYWIGSHREGVCRYDGNSFEYFTVNEGLPDNQIRSIKEDVDGNIWFGTAKGVGSYVDKKITNHVQTISGDSPSEWVKTNNDLWFNAGNNTGVYRYDGQKLDYLAFPALKIVNSDNAYLVTSLAKGKNNMLWIGTYAGIFGYNGSRFTIINDETLELEETDKFHIKTALGYSKGTGKLHIRSVFEDSKGRLWIGNNGIGVLLKDGDTTINFSEKHELIHPMSTGRGDKSPSGTLEHVFAIEEDGDGTIWFGDRDTGAWKYDGKSVTNYIVDAKLSTPMVWSIYNDKNNNLLFGMADGGVYMFNGKSFDRIF